MEHLLMKDNNRTCWNNHIRGLAKTGLRLHAMTLNGETNKLNKLPNGYTTSNPRRFDMDITSISRRPNFDEFPRHFRVLFRCDFAGRKIHVVSTYFFRCNFDGRNMHVVFTYFFRRNFDGQRFDIIFGKL